MVWKDLDDPRGPDCWVWNFGVWNSDVLIFGVWSLDLGDRRELGTMDWIRQDQKAMLCEWDWNQRYPAVARDSAPRSSSAKPWAIWGRRMTWKFEDLKQR